MIFASFDGSNEIPLVTHGYVVYYPGVQNKWSVPIYEMVVTRFSTVTLILFKVTQCILVKLVLSFGFGCLSKLPLNSFCLGLLKSLRIILLYRHMQIHADYNDTMNKDERLFLEKYNSHFIWNVCACERELETKQNCDILTPTLMTISVVSFSFSWAAQPEAWCPTLLCAGFLHRILSLTHLLSK